MSTFGAVALGGAPVARTFTVSNVGLANLTGLALTKDGANAGDFAVDALAATSLAPGASFTFTVSSAQAQPGPRTAALHLASNDPDENPFDIALAGSAGWQRPFAGMAVDPLRQPRQQWRRREPERFRP